MMFDGDHRIGVEPYSPYFADIGLDAVVARRRERYTFSRLRI